ncbi:MAG TPA: cupin domain-containing protein [Kofleriaceae bacterium]|jgi:mannose-6-phosphate isomerase-like protein (cupin superfamily)|nr:cupin domain-containing protein [Kofleriaceae bacterium]
MKHTRTTDRGPFEVLHSTPTSQAAMMTLAPGESSSESSDNEHAWAEQWLYVVSGQGVATSGKKRIALKVGSLLLIEKGEPHQIENTGKTPLVTLNVYAPPGYDDDGEPLY